MPPVAAGAPTPTLNAEAWRVGEDELGVDNAPLGGTTGSCSSDEDSTLSCSPDKLKMSIPWPVTLPQLLTRGRLDQEDGRMRLERIPQFPKQ